MDQFASYTNPPLFEVSIGLQFQRLDRMKIPHFGGFWEKIKQEFPIVEHAAPIIQNQPVADDFFPLPRVWFIDSSDTRLVQLQPDRINFNWRFRPTSDPYPRFHMLAPKFFDLLDMFEKLIAKENIGIIQPTVAEITYINIFEHGREWNNTNDIDKILKDFIWNPETSRFLPCPEKLSWAAMFPLPGGQGTLSAKLNQGVRVTDKVQIMQFELIANYPVQEVAGVTTESLKSWYTLAHEWIVKGFNDLTQPEAQVKYWGRTE